MNQSQIMYINLLYIKFEDRAHEHHGTKCRHARAQHTQRTNFSFPPKPTAVAVKVECVNSTHPVRTYFNSFPGHSAPRVHENTHQKEDIFYIKLVCVYINTISTSGYGRAPNTNVVCVRHIKRGIFAYTWNIDTERGNFVGVAGALMSMCYVQPGGCVHNTRPLSNMALDAACRWVGRSVGRVGCIT